MFVQQMCPCAKIQAVKILEVTLKLALWIGCSGVNYEELSPPSRVPTILLGVHAPAPSDQDLQLQQLNNHHAERCDGAAAALQRRRRSLSSPAMISTFLSPRGACATNWSLSASARQRPTAR